MKCKLISLLFLLTIKIIPAVFANETINVIATKFPNGDLLEVVKPILKQNGYNLEIKEIPSYSGHGIVTVRGNISQEINDPNQQVFAGKSDANFFQPAIYLEEYNKLHEADLTNIGKVFYIPFAIYLSPNHKVESASIASLADKHEGMTVGIPYNYIDASRALKLLEVAKLIELDKSKKISSLTDVSANPYHLHIVQVDNEILPQLLLSNSLDMVVMNSGRAYLKNLLPSASSLLENNPDVYSNVVVTTKVSSTDPKFKALVNALNSPQVRQYIEKNYQGTVKPSF